eukprot:TRINITY_DN20296_c0_g1_i1.p2 TRINITY_DN20296_c0_g1~~TRINITY_DN20296_c0_g1_i1.p2  ORF type:complete len:363 (+),score=140.11 TRINITY_DN20296_c0_g1_i1:55-1143(+)
MAASGEEEQEQAATFVPVDMPKLPRCKADDEDMERLHQAARRGNAELVERLINQGIVAGTQNKFGCTALHLACRRGYVPVLRALAVHRPSLHSTWHGLRPVHLAVQSGKVEVVHELVAMAEAQGIDAPTFLSEPDDHETAEVGSFELEELTAGQTAVHWAIGLEMPEMLDALIAAGASLLARDKRGRSPMHCAVQYKQPKIFTDLLEKSSALHIQDIKGRTCLHTALEMGVLNYAFEICEHERENPGEQGYSALVSTEDKSDKTPVQHAVEMAELPLLQSMLSLIEPAKFQKLPFHEGRFILTERIQWNDDRERDVRRRDDNRDHIVRALQRKLDDVNAMEVDQRVRKRMGAGAGDARGRRV